MSIDFIENKQKELKREYSDSILKTISAFANYEGGKIVIGVDESKKEVVGISDYISVKLKIENIINDTVLPRPRYEIKLLKYDNKDIIEILVYPGFDTPYLYKGRAYQRSDTSTVPVDQKTLTELSLKGRNISYDQLETNENELEFKILGKKLKDIKSIEVFDKDILITLGLYTRNKYNIAATLLADTNNLITLGLDMVRFGNTTSEFIERKTVVGKSILLQYEEAMEMFLRWYPEIEKIVGVKRIKQQPIPYEAFREGVANAIAHRDYMLNSQIKIEMYDNRIEITSPGGLPSGITKENYLKDNLSVARNIVISQVLYTLGIIEKFGTGIKRMNDAYLGYDKKPVYVIKDNFIKVILPNIIFKDDNLSEEIRVMNLLDIKVEITRKDVEDLLGVNKSKAVDIINSLIKENLIESFGLGKNIFYKKIK
jgi:ATP-dependent DNA helicase RecG